MASAPTFIDCRPGEAGENWLDGAGWKGNFEIEKDSWAFETLKHNFMGAPMLETPILGQNGSSKKTSPNPSSPPTHMVH